MRNKGLVLFFTILIALACIYCLSFTIATKNVEKKALAYATAGEAHDKAVKEAIATFEDVNDVKATARDKKRITEDVENSLEREYLDRMKDSSIWLGFTYGASKDKEINLGLDLQGGMSVTLAVSSPQLVQQLCGESYAEDPLFTESFNAAVKEYNHGANGTDFLDIYEKHAKAKNVKLATFFGENLGMPNADNASIIANLKQKRAETMDDTYEILRTRIDRYGVAQPNIQTDAAGRIIVELPGVKDKKRVEDLLKSTAQLEFWQVVPTTNGFPATFKNAVVELAQEAESNGDADAQKELLDIAQHCGIDPYAVAQFPLGDTAKMGKHLPAIIKKLGPSYDYVYYWGKADKKDKMCPLVPLQKYSKECGPVLCNKTISKGARIIRNAEQNVDEYQRVIVNMTMEEEAADQWQRITKQYKGECIAIVLDQLVYSYPRINDEIANGRSQISGNFDVQEAKELAIVLNSGGLDVALDIISSDLVGPSLGEKSRNSGLVSFALAFCLVLLYMFLYYNRAGLVADFALLCNVFFLVGVLASLNAVLSLPGMAGIVLTLGMAVDANVLIYERIREEVRNGKGMRLAVADGYKNAYSAIIDGNVTTLITGIVLYMVGSGPVKGFAITLIIGILSSLFTAIFISRLIFERRMAKGKTIKLGNRVTMDAFVNAHYNFLGAKKIAYIISCSLIAIMIVSFCTLGLQRGIDFAGGRTYVVLFDKDVDGAEAAKAVTAEFGGNPQVKNYGAADQLRVTINYDVDNPSEAVEQACKDKLYKSLKGFYTYNISQDEFENVKAGENGIQSASRVQAAMASELIGKAILAVLISIIIIFIYIAIRFRNWQFGLGSIITLLHDTIITIGMFSLFWKIAPFSMEVDQQFIAAVLTVIGYSINNVVIIYDRIRENLTISPKSTYEINFNNAINSTLGRNVNTCGTTIMVLLVIFIMGFFGGENIQGFVFAMLMGIICGTYSGIFIAPNLALDMLKRSNKKAKVAKIQLMK